MPQAAALKMKKGTRVRKAAEEYVAQRSRISDVSRSETEQNMGRATAGANQIYAVVRPERPSGARVQRGKPVAIAEGAAYIFNFSFSIY